jgi:hypothetical protein
VNGRFEEARTYLQEALDQLNMKKFQKTHVWITKFAHHLANMTSSSADKSM